MAGLAPAFVALLALGGAWLPMQAVGMPATPVGTHSAIEDDVVRAEIAALSAGGAKAREPLAAERRAVLETLAAALELRRLRASTRDAGASRAPPPADGVPPHPVPRVDAARDYVDSLRGEQATLEAALQSLERDEDALVASLRDAQEQQRLWDERARAEPAASQQRLALARAELARWRARQEALQLADTREATRRATARLARLRAELADWTPRIEAWRRAQVLDEASMAEALAQIAQERAQLARELAGAESRLASSRGKAGAWADVAVVLRERDAVLRGREDVWRLRQRLFSGQGPNGEEQRRILDDAIAQLDARRRWGQGQLAFDRTSVGNAGQAEPGAEAALLYARQQLVATLSRSMSLLERTRDDLQAAAAPPGLASTVRGWFDTLGRLARQAWETELFVVTDTVLVEGREVPRELGITVGKSLGAVALLALGYVAIRWLALPALGFMLARAGVEDRRRRTLHRWASWLLFALLLVVVLKLARIPLVAFAFLGGALAIGIGFGAQTLLRNLMSGLLLLAERKVKVGDVLTVGATSGTCADVGLRATTLHGFDGIDVIIPNSTLLENPIQNWRSRDGRIRREVRVLLPYACPPDQAAALVAACAEAEPAILREPAPEVLLVRLGEGGFELALQFWVELGARPLPPTLESRLRLAICAALAERGVEPGWQTNVRAGIAAPATGGGVA